MEKSAPANQHPTQPDVNRGSLPDPLVAPGGSKITSPAEWPACAKAWLDLVVGMEYGGLPPKPEAMQFETLCHSTIRRYAGHPKNWTYRIHCLGGAKPLTFSVRIIFPQSDAPVPAIINGDGCWWYLSDEVVEHVLAAGCALVVFNRTEVAEDLGYSGVEDKTRRSGGIYEVYPGLDYGALAAWAWGYHRCVDFLSELPFIDSNRLGVTGHSRGGKTALLAGATDPRIALVNDNAGGCGGSGLFRYVGHGGETLNILNVFPSWFGRGLAPFLGREGDLPFDQHCLLAAVAPRPLLCTFALEDRWSNPEGMVLAVGAAGAVYRFLNAGDNIAFHLRPGRHAHTCADWQALVDFIGWKWFDRSPCSSFNQHPYSHLAA